MLRFQNLLYNERLWLPEQLVDRPNVPIEEQIEYIEPMINVLNEHGIEPGEEDARVIEDGFSGNMNQETEQVTDGEQNETEQDVTEHDVREQERAEHDVTEQERTEEDDKRVKEIEEDSVLVPKVHVTEQETVSEKLYKDNDNQVAEYIASVEKEIAQGFRSETTFLFERPILINTSAVSSTSSIAPVTPPASSFTGQPMYSSPNQTSSIFRRETTKLNTKRKNLTRKIKNANIFGKLMAH